MYHLLIFKKRFLLNQYIWKYFKEKKPPYTIMFEKKLLQTYSNKNICCDVALIIISYSNTKLNSVKLKI